jgi:uncharacterized membrane protein HdeD (DUF308 family)
LDSLLLLALSFRDVRTRERNWHIAESAIDGAFSILLLLDPVFSLLVFPVVIPPWMAVKGLIKIIGALSNGRHMYTWWGDILGGTLLLCFSLLIPHTQDGDPYNAGLLTGLMGWTLGFIYCYDYLKSRSQRPFSIKGSL